MIKKNTKIEPVEVDIPDDDDHTPDDEAIRSHLEHDTLEFEGRPLRPLTGAIVATMLKTGSKLLNLDVSNLYFDTATFVLLATTDEEEYRTARRLAFTPQWTNYVLDWIDADPVRPAKLQLIALKIAKQIKDWDSLQAEYITKNAPKKDGGHTG